MMALDSALKLQGTDTANESLQCVDSSSFRYDSLDRHDEHVRCCGYWRHNKENDVVPQSVMGCCLQRF